jgi:hypothetical protein
VQRGTEQAQSNEHRQVWEAPTLSKIGSFGDVMRGGSPGTGEGVSGMMDKNP